MNTFALKYTQSTVRGTGFQKTLVGVREPIGVWRPPKEGATVEQAVKYLLDHGWRFAGRSHYNGGGLKTTTEVWEQGDQ